MCVQSARERTGCAEVGAPEGKMGWSAVCSRPIAHSTNKTPPEVSMVRFRLLAPLVLVAAPVLAGGSITGVVNYSGPAPKQEKIDRKTDPVCTKSDAFDESILLSKDGKALQNVVLRLKNGPAGP